LQDLLEPRVLDICYAHVSQPTQKVTTLIYKDAKLTVNSITKRDHPPFLILIEKNIEKEVHSFSLFGRKHRTPLSSSTNLPSEPPHDDPHQPPSLLHLKLQIPILQNGSRLSRQQSPLRRLILRFESVADRLHGHPLDAFELVDVLDVPLQHHQAVRVAADVWVHCYGVDEASLTFLASCVGFNVLAVEELEAIHPHFFDVARVDPAVAVRGFLL
jgi:hypothetical protein